MPLSSPALPTTLMASTLSQHLGQQSARSAPRVKLALRALKARTVLRENLLKLETTLVLPVQQESFVPQSISQYKRALLGLSPLQDPRPRVLSALPESRVPPHLRLPRALELISQQKALRAVKAVLLAMCVRTRPKQTLNFAQTEST